MARTTLLAAQTIYPGAQLADVAARCAVQQQPIQVKLALCLRDPDRQAGAAFRPWKDQTYVVALRDREDVEAFRDCLTEMAQMTTMLSPRLVVEYLRVLKGEVQEKAKRVKAEHTEQMLKEHEARREARRQERRALLAREAKEAAALEGEEGEGEDHEQHERQPD